MPNPTPTEIRIPTHAPPLTRKQAEPYHHIPQSQSHPIHSRSQRRNPPALPPRQRQTLRPHAAVIMPDHVHLLLLPLRDEKGWPYSLPTILKLLKGCSARTVNKLSGADGPVWQEESLDHVLRSQESFEEKLEYVRQNPVRRGLANNRKTTSALGRAISREVRQPVWVS